MRPLPKLLLFCVVLAACHAPPKAPVDAGPPPVVSQEILVRPVQTSQAEVQYVLIGWKELASAYRGRMGPRARSREQSAAETAVRSVLQAARTGTPFEQLMKDYSDDASGQFGGTVVVKPDGRLEPQFQALALRLHVGEVGVCQTAYGYHVIKRVK